LKIVRQSRHDERRNCEHTATEVPGRRRGVAKKRTRKQYRLYDFTKPHLDHRTKCDAAMPPRQGAASTKWQAFANYDCRVSGPGRIMDDDSMTMILEARREDVTIEPHVHGMPDDPPARQRGPATAHDTARGRCLRNWLIVGNLMGWVLILLVAHSIF
jgi:hypothetical protein